jgi:hypothetical protein
VEEEEERKGSFVMLLEGMNFSLFFANIINTEEREREIN